MPQSARHLVQDTLQLRLPPSLPYGNGEQQVMVHNSQPGRQEPLSPASLDLGQAAEPDRYAASLLSY
jgi:hypothetical protein